MIIAEQVYFDKVKDDTNILIKNNKNNKILTVRVANLDIIIESLVLAFFWKKMEEQKISKQTLQKVFSLI